MCGFQRGFGLQPEGHCAKLKHDTRTNDFLWRTTGGWTWMGLKPKYYIVDAEALPPVFLKVAEAKRLLESGEAGAVNEAARSAGISRSAFYKYKDMVRPFNDMLHGRIVTVQALLKDEPGILSAVLNIFAQSGGNILTINQGIPISGCAVVNIGAETSAMVLSVEELIAKVGELVEYGDTTQLFSMPNDKRTEDYITGRFG